MVDFFIVTWLLLKNNGLKYESLTSSETKDLSIKIKSMHSLKNGLNEHMLLKKKTNVTLLNVHAELKKWD